MPCMASGVLDLMFFFVSEPSLNTINMLIVAHDPIPLGHTRYELKLLRADI